MVFSIIALVQSVHLVHAEVTQDNALIVLSWLDKI